MLIKKEIHTNRHEEIIDITNLVAQEIAKHPVQEGRVLVFIPHTTAGVTINENADPSVKRDILLGLESFAFEKLPFSHAEGNSPAHLKTTLVGNSVDIIIKDGRLLFGTWQGIYFCEFDGPRNRNIYMQF